MTIRIKRSATNLNSLRLVSTFLNFVWSSWIWSVLLKMRNFGPKSSVISGKESAMTDPYEGFSGEIDEQLVDCEVDPDEVTLFEWPLQSSVPMTSIQILDFLRKNNQTTSERVLGFGIWCLKGWQQLLSNVNLVMFIVKILTTLSYTCFGNDLFLNLTISKTLQTLLRQLSRKVTDSKLVCVKNFYQVIFT